MARADKYTLERKKVEMYSDFSNNFDRNPVTKILGKVTNEESVKQSLRNIVLTICGERFYDSNKGSKVNQSLFENYDPSLLDVLRIQLREACAYEPRAMIHDVRLNENLDGNGYDATIVFSIINIPDQLFQTTLTVLRVR